MTPFAAELADGRGTRGCIEFHSHTTDASIQQREHPARGDHARNHTRDDAVERNHGQHARDERVLIPVQPRICTDQPLQHQPQSHKKLQPD
jgi:hypothetical protein